MSSPLQLAIDAFEAAPDRAHEAGQAAFTHEVLQACLEHPESLEPAQVQQAWALLFACSDALVLTFLQGVATKVLGGQPLGRARLADACWQQLAAPAQAQRTSVMQALALLLLRQFMPADTDQAALSRLHRAVFLKLPIEGKKLLYNFAFSPDWFQWNRGDLERFMADPGTLREVAAHPDARHWLFLALAFERPLAHRPGLAQLLAQAPCEAGISDTAGAAARTLIVKLWPHWSADDRARVARQYPELADQGEQLVAHTPPRPHVAPDPALLGAILSARRQRVEAARALVMRRLPGWLEPRRRPRLALCVSGQLRGYREAFQSWQNTLLRAFDVDIYVHSWHRVGRASADPSRYMLPFEGSHFTQAYRKACRDVGYAEMRERYPHLFLALSEVGSVTVEELQQFYGTRHVVLEDETKGRYAGLSNPGLFHAKIHACHQLMREQGIEYDLVMRMRPDKAVRHIGFDARKIEQACKSRPLIFTDHASGFQFGNVQIGDQVALGTPALMDVYANTWLEAPARHRLGLWGHPEAFRGHGTLAQQCWLHDIAAPKIPIAFGPLLETGPLRALEVQTALRQDANGRDDAIDADLLAAAQRDLPGLNEPGGVP
jgi:hypothetical protein